MVAEEVKKQEAKGFNEVKNWRDSLFDVVLKKAPEVAIVQDLGSINTGMQIQNVRIPPHAIKTNNEDLNSSLHHLQYFSIDINALSTQTLVHMQRVANQKLEDREKSING